VREEKRSSSKHKSERVLNTKNKRERENEPPRTPWGDYPLPSPKPYRPLIKSYLHLTAGNCSRQTLATALNIPRIQRPWFHPLDLTIFIHLPSSACFHPLVFIRCLLPSNIIIRPFIAVPSCHSCPSLFTVVVHVLRPNSVSFTVLLYPSSIIASYKLVDMILICNHIPPF
jgi:hypothetical protein